jgi:hypothetical protein
MTRLVNEIKEDMYKHLNELKENSIKQLNEIRKIMQDMKDASSKDKEILIKLKTWK